MLNLEVAHLACPASLSYGPIRTQTYWLENKCKMGICHNYLQLWGKKVFSSKTENAAKSGADDNAAILAAWSKEELGVVKFIKNKTKQKLWVFFIFKGVAAEKCPSRLLSYFPGTRPESIGQGKSCSYPLRPVIIWTFQLNSEKNKTSHLGI